LPFGEALRWIKGTVLQGGSAKMQSVAQDALNHGCTGARQIRFESKSCRKATSYALTSNPE
jgi:hypothetical protein